jgi:hypothetical protein
VLTKELSLRSLEADFVFLFFDLEMDDLWLFLERVELFKEVFFDFRLGDFRIFESFSIFESFLADVSWDRNGGFVLFLVLRKNLSFSLDDVLESKGSSK